MRARRSLPAFSVVGFCEVAVGSLESASTAPIPARQKRSGSERFPWIVGRRDSRGYALLHRVTEADKHAKRYVARAGQCKRRPRNGSEVCREDQGLFVSCEGIEIRPRSGPKERCQVNQSSGRMRGNVWRYKAGNI